MTLDLADVEALEKLEKAASVAPWEWANKQHLRDGYADLICCADFGPGEIEEIDRELIAASRNAVPELLALAKEALLARDWKRDWEADISPRISREAYFALVSAHQKKEG